MPTQSNSTLAIITKNKLNPAYDGARIGADRTAAELGFSTRHYIPEQADDANEQAALIDLALSEAPAAMAIVPVDSAEVLSALKRVETANIPVVMLVGQPPEARCLTFVGSSDYTLGYNLADFLFLSMGGRGTVALINGHSDALTAPKRRHGFLDAAKAYPDIRIVADVDGRYQKEPARQVMSRLLAEGVLPDAVCAANDVMALGALEALRSVGHRSRVVGANATPEGVRAIEAGDILASASFDAMTMACLSVQAAVRHLGGLKVPGEIEVPVELVTKRNCEQWDVPYEKRNLPRWTDFVAE